MLEKLFTALVFELLTFATKHKNFFDANKEERKKIIHTAKLCVPQSIEHYLTMVSGNVFQKDMTIILAYLTKKNTVHELEKTSIIEAIVDYLTHEFAERLEMKHMEKESHEPKQGKHIFQKTEDDIFNNYTYQEMTQDLWEFLKKLKNAPLIIVQSPQRIDMELKKEIRETLQKKYADSLPIFQVNSALIGGLRLFIDGKTYDYSWISRINILSGLRI